MLCTKWQIWKPPYPGCGLGFEFQIRNVGSERSFPIYFGTTMMTEPVVFPVGGLKDNFTLEVVALIYDCIGDFYRLIEIVTVSQFL